MESADQISQAGQQLERALLHELVIYDKLLRALQDQQEAIMNRAAEKVVVLARAIDSHMVVIGLAREERARLEESLARTVGSTEPEKYSELLPMLPNDVRGRIGAIVVKINDRLGHVQRYARQNNILLERSVELSQELLRRLGKRWEVSPEPS